MADDTAIEWADATWNPIVGCEIVSPGCKHCYAMGQAARIERMAAGAGRATHYAGTTQPSKAGPVWTGKVALAPEAALNAPLRWTRPRRIFVNSMGDLFAEGVPIPWIDRVFAVMALAPQHTFIVLTKRAGRMREYLSGLGTPRRIYEDACDGAILANLNVVLIAPGADEAHAPSGKRVYLGVWPLPNVWLGVTAEDQLRADERIPELLQTPAAKRIVSAEPMVGPVNLRSIDLDGWSEIHPLAGDRDYEDDDGNPGAEWPALDWVIVGGESGRGPNIRPMHPAWARQMRDDCAAAGVPFFFKQWGEWTPGENVERKRGVVPAAWADADEAWHFGEQDLAQDDLHVDDEPTVYRVGKAAAGGRLDGVTHHAFPEARP